MSGRVGLDAFAGILAVAARVIQSFYMKNTSKENIVKRHFMTALIATFVLAGVSGIGIASAQTVPAAAKSTTVAQSQETPAEAPKPKPRKPFVVIHITPMATYNVGGADAPRPASDCAPLPSKSSTIQGGSCGPSGNYEFADPATNLGYGATFNLAPRWTLNYVHSYVNQNIGTITNYKGETTYQQFNNDRTDDASLGYTMGAYVISAGWHERVRQCCGNPPVQSDAGQTAYHYDYLQGATRFGTGSKYFGKLFGLTLQGAYEPHTPSAAYYANPACLGYATAAQCATHPYEIPGEGNKFHITYTGNMTLPIGGKDSSFALFGTYLNNWDYFENQPVMFLYNEADYGFIKKFSPFVTLTATNSNLYEHHEGWPYVNPNTVNRNKLLVTLDFALPIY